MNKPLKLYWSTSLKKGRKNFGDALSPVICEFLSKRKVVHARPNDCDLIAVGSVLQKAKNHIFARKMHIWGSGHMKSRNPYSSRHTYHAVRGKKTAALIKNDVQALGDPGLLCDLLVPDLSTSHKDHSVGLIPHYKEQDHPLLTSFLEKNKKAVFIDILSETVDFIEQVARCEVILSTSLHGLVTADAFGIPNAWVCLSDLPCRGGNGFKFHDYYSVFGLEAQPFDLNENTTEEQVLTIANDYNRPNLGQIKKDLIASFPFTP